MAVLCGWRFSAQLPAVLPRFELCQRLAQFKRIYPCQSMHDHKGMNTTAQNPTPPTAPPQPQTALQIDRLLRIRDVCHATGLARSTVYAKISEAGFPQPVRVHGKCVAWKESEVSAWIASLPRVSIQGGHA